MFPKLETKFFVRQNRWKCQEGDSERPALRQYGIDSMPADR